MGVNYFSEDQIQKLKQNTYIDNVSKKAITYSEEFKNHFSIEYEKGKMPTRIFLEAGIDPEIVGELRISGFSKRNKIMKTRSESFTDLRSQNSGRPRTKERTLEEEVTYLKHQIALQKQQIEALKKTNSINRKEAQALHKRNINLSKH